MIFPITWPSRVKQLNVLRCSSSPSSKREGVKISSATNNFWTTFECEPSCRGKRGLCTHLLSICLVSRSVTQATGQKRIGKSCHTCQALQNQVHFFSHREISFLHEVCLTFFASQSMDWDSALSSHIALFLSDYLALMQCHCHFIGR